MTPDTADTMSFVAPTTDYVPRIVASSKGFPGEICTEILVQYQAMQPRAAWFDPRRDGQHGNPGAMPGHEGTPSRKGTTRAPTPPPDGMV